MFLAKHWIDDEWRGAAGRRWWGMFRAKHRPTAPADKKTRFFNALPPWHTKKRAFLMFRAKH
ncbi:MAG: hypothetical protein MPK03_05220, partial [Alphaproteobacteria bacterium]|nr:hypothetical protein [Alphaproteobacteria bacterium]